MPPDREIDTSSDPPNKQDTPSPGNVTSGDEDTPPFGHGPDGASQSAVESAPERLGQFEIRGLIGRGGMGDVYKGYDPTLGRHVAIKVLPANLARDDDFVHRFHCEATAAAKIAHPNIVPVHFIGEDDGYHFFAMQFIEGESLTGRLARFHRLSLDEALRIVEQCLAGLEAAHAQGLIHRDIKPGNILLDAGTGNAILVDFGLVRVIGRSTRMTATGMIMGTADYIAPEQARGQPVDARTDIYALGVLLYQLLSGRLPFVADSPTAMIFQHAYEAPLPLEEAAPDVPEPVVRIVARMMAKDPADRYSTCSAVLDDVHAFRQGLPLSKRASAEKATKTTVLPAPQPAPDLELPQVLAGLGASGPFGRLRDRVATIFRRHAPEFVKELQSTTQQVDGAVAEYERRSNRLANLLLEARGILDELSNQIQLNREAAAAAEDVARSATDEEKRQAAEDKKRECEENVALLEKQHGEQQRQIDEIQRQLNRAGATLVRLRSQRDLLKARLRAARARGVAGAGPVRLGRRQMIGLVAVVACLILGGLAASVGLLALGVASLLPRFSNEPDPATAAMPLQQTVPPRQPEDAAGTVDGIRVEREVLTNSIGMQFVLIPAGEFIMGTPKTEMDVMLNEKDSSSIIDEEHGPNEYPAHRVFLSTAFFMGMHEVTQGEFERVMGSNPSRHSPGRGDKSRHPVDSVSDRDAEDFCKTLSSFPAEEEARRSYRLPTEAEWEYAYRAGSADDHDYIAHGGGRFCVGVGRWQPALASELRGHEHRRFVSPQRVRTVRHARQRLGVVLRLVRPRVLSAEPFHRPTGRVEFYLWGVQEEWGHDQGESDPRRRLQQRRGTLPPRVPRAQDCALYGRCSHGVSRGLHRPGAA